MESYDECSSMYSGETIIWPPINFLCSLERLWGIPKEVVKVCKQIDSTVLFAVLDDGTEIYEFQMKDENVPNLLRGGIQIYNSAPLTNNPLTSAMEQSTGMVLPMEPQRSTATASTATASTATASTAAASTATAPLIEQEMAPSMELPTSFKEWCLNKYLESILGTPLEIPLAIPLEDAVPDAPHVKEQPPMPSRRQPSRHCKRPFNYKYNF